MIRPTFRNVLMKKVEEPEQTGLIYMVSHAEIYEILAVGPQVDRFEAGNKVMLRIQKPRKYEYKSEFYFIENECLIAAVVS